MLTCGVDGVAHILRARMCEATGARARQLEVLNMADMRRFPAIAAVLTLLLACTAGAEPTIAITPQEITVGQWTHFWVETEINDEVTGVAGYHMLVDFDETKMHVTQVLEGFLPHYSGEQTFFYWQAEGMPSDAVLIDGAILGAHVDGPGSLSAINFYTDEPGLSPIDFMEVDLRDTTNAVIPVTMIGGQVYISPGLNVEEVDSWGKIKALFKN